MQFLWIPVSATYLQAPTFNNITLQTLQNMYLLCYWRSCLRSHTFFKFLGNYRTALSSHSNKEDLTPNYPNPEFSTGFQAKMGPFPSKPQTLLVQIVNPNNPIARSLHIFERRREDVSISDRRSSNSLPINQKKIATKRIQLSATIVGWFCPWNGKFAEICA
jgi:hypothetical protein